MLSAATTVAVYAPIRDEPDLAQAVDRWWREGRQVALPIVVGRDQPLVFAAYRPDTVLEIARFGVPVPRDRELVLPDAIVLPCVGFRVWGGRAWRLGYGAGFYDRTLAHRPVPAVGVAYDEAETDGFEPAPYDAALSAIATPSRCITSIASP